MLVQVRVTSVPSCMSPGGQMDTDVCGGSVRENITCLITCVTNMICLTHEEQECLALYKRDTRVTNTNHSRLYLHTYTHTHANMFTHKHTHTHKTHSLTTHTHTHT